MARAKPVKQKSNNGANVGYEINFNRDFYRYTPPRPLEEIETDIVRMLAEVTGSAVNSK